MNYSLDIGMWNQVFAVPCALVDRHLKLAGKEQLQVILWMLRHAGQSFSPESMAEALGMSVDSALDGMDYWADQGLLAQSGEELRPLPQQAVPTLPAQEAAKPAAASTGPAAPEKPVLPPKKRMIRPDGSHLTARMAEAPEMQFLIQEAQATFGKTISPAMSTLLVTIVDDYGLPAEVTVMLLHYVQEVGKTGTSYIDSVARDWAESGIFSVELAEQKLQDLSRRRLAWSRVASAAGLPKRSPSKKEEEAACRWVYDWNFSQEMLSAAYDRCADHTGKFSAAYMDKVLGRWNGLGIRNLQELDAAESGERPGASGKSPEKTAKSYDIGELESMSSFDVPDNL